MAHRIDFARSAAKQLASLSGKVRRRISEKIDALKDDPLPRGMEKLAGEEDLYRVRSGDYRIIYRYQSGVLTILVLKIAHRREVYRNL